MGLFFPILGGAFVLCIIVIGAFAFATILMGTLGGTMAYIINGKRDPEVFQKWMMTITVLITIIGMLWFISLF